MAIRVGSSSINFIRKPEVRPPYMDMSVNSMEFGLWTSFVIGGMLQGIEGDDATGWTLGFIQVQLIETNWGYYRGKTNTDGSCFIQRGRPPARPSQSCFDTFKPGVFIDNNHGYTTPNGDVMPPDLVEINKGTQFPIKVATVDYPGDRYPFKRLNSQTQKDNFLHEAQVEMHFCTVLSLASPKSPSSPRVFQHLKHFTWNLRWHARFQPDFANPSGWKIKPLGGQGNGPEVSRVFDGEPTDRRFAELIKAAGTSNMFCTLLSRDAEKNVKPQEYRTWHDFDVRR